MILHNICFPGCKCVISLVLATSPFLSDSSHAFPLCECSCKPFHCLWGDKLDCARTWTQRISLMPFAIIFPTFRVWLLWGAEVMFCFPGSIVIRSNLCHFCHCPLLKTAFFTETYESIHHAFTAGGESESLWSIQTPQRLQRKMKQKMYQIMHWEKMSKTDSSKILHDAFHSWLQNRKSPYMQPKKHLCAAGPKGTCLSAWKSSIMNCPKERTLHGPTKSSTFPQCISKNRWSCCVIRLQASKETGTKQSAIVSELLLHYFLLEFSNTANQSTQTKTAVDKIPQCCKIWVHHCDQMSCFLKTCSAYKVSENKSKNHIFIHSQSKFHNDKT